MSVMNKQYCEVVVEGSFDLIRGFVVGLLEGHGIRGEAIFREDHHVENEGRFGQMLRLVGVKGNHFHLIIGVGFLKLLEKSLERRKAELALKLISEKTIKQASFKFHYRVFTRELGDELKSLFGNLAEALWLSDDYKPKETVIPEGKGVEAYAPLHEYKLEATGTVCGPVREIIDLYGRAEHYDLVELGSIKLEYDKQGV